MDKPTREYSLQDLCERAGVTARTVRYYIQQGLLPAPDAAGGPGAHYRETHLARLARIRELQKQHLPLAEIRKHLDVDPGDAPASESAPRSAAEYVARVLRGTLAAPPRRAEPPSPSVAPPSSSEQRSERSTWERIALTQDIEIHVRRPLSRPQNRQLERLLALARTLFEEPS